MNSTLKTADHPVTDHVFDAIVIGVGVIENEVTQKVCPAGMTTLAKSLLKKIKCFSFRSHIETNICPLTTLFSNRGVLKT